MGLRLSKQKQIAFSKDSNPGLHEYRRIWIHWIMEALKPYDCLQNKNLNDRKRSSLCKMSSSCYHHSLFRFCNEKKKKICSKRFVISVIVSHDYLESRFFTINDWSMRGWERERESERERREKVCTREREKVWARLRGIDAPRRKSKLKVFPVFEECCGQLRKVRDRHRKRREREKGNRERQIKRNINRKNEKENRKQEKKRYEKSKKAKKEKEK